MSVKLVGSYRFKDYPYPKNHPLRIPRIALLLEFLETLGILEEGEVVESRFARDDEVLLFHQREYYKALKKYGLGGRLNLLEKKKFNLGNFENPLSPASYWGSLLAVGSSLQAGELFLKGFIPFSPSGGMHHAKKNRADGFCFLNDVCILIEDLKRKGFRKILYIDLDAHHPDGVQEAYYEDDSVFLLSLHQSPEYAYPFKRGFLEEVGRGKGKYYNLNVPLPKGLSDSEFLYVIEGLIPLLKEIFKPEVVIFQLGTDALYEDYLSKFNLSNLAFLEGFKLLYEEFNKRAILLGGGGYHPLSLLRCWALIWCYLKGTNCPNKFNGKVKDFLKKIDFEELEEGDRSYLLESLKDSWRWGEVRGEVKGILEKVKTIFPL